jgi:prophage regulatory protein
MKFIKVEDVLKMTCLSRTGLYKRIREGSFPRQIKLGERAAVWNEELVINWMNNQIGGINAEQ